MLKYNIFYILLFNFKIQISDTLLRQSEHYNNMASKFSNLKFTKVEPESEEEIEQFTTPITPGIRRSTRKRFLKSYNNNNNNNKFSQ